MAFLLNRLWQRLETGFPPGGPRRHLRSQFGDEAVAAFEHASVLKPQQLSRTYPCPRRGQGCDRIVVPMGERYHAVCGASPAECDDLDLVRSDIERLVLDPPGLCRAIAAVLQIRGSPEAVAGLATVYRVGTFIPEPGIRHPIYLAVRATPQAYAEAVEALRSRQDGKPFGLLMPTDRFLADDVERQAQAAGIMVLALTDVVDLRDGRLAALADPLRLFAGIGQRGAALSLVGATIAEAYLCDGSSPPRWIDLDEGQYQALVASASQYHVFADEITKTVVKGQGRETAQASHFRIIRQVIRKRGYFNPADEMLASAQQIFQRARKLFDPRPGTGRWKLFKTIKDGETSLYHFSPDPGTSFAFVFLPADTA